MPKTNDPSELSGISLSIPPFKHGVFIWGHNLTGAAFFFFFLGGGVSLNHPQKNVRGNLEGPQIWGHVKYPTFGCLPDKNNILLNQLKVPENF